MEDYNDNSIRHFKCQLCNGEYKMIKFIVSKNLCGYMCENCWKKYYKRMNEIYGKRWNL
jgi:hypothetical protein